VVALSQPGLVRRKNAKPYRRILDKTTGEIISHPATQPKDGCQVVGYSHSTRLSKSAAKSLVIRKLAAP
jgi:hypothetical protein